MSKYHQEMDEVTYETVSSSGGTSSTSSAVPERAAQSGKSGLLVLSLWDQPSWRGCSRMPRWQRHGLFHVFLEPHSRRKPGTTLAGIPFPVWFVQLEFVNERNSQKTWRAEVKQKPFFSGHHVRDHGSGCTEHSVSSPVMAPLRWPGTLGSSGLPSLPCLQREVVSHWVSWLPFQTLLPSFHMHKLGALRHWPGHFIVCGPLSCDFHWILSTGEIVYHLLFFVCLL